MTCGPAVVYLGRSFPIYYDGYLVGLSVKPWVIPFWEMFWEGSPCPQKQVILFKCVITFCCPDLIINGMLTTRSSTGEHWGVFCILALQTDYSVSSLLADARLFLLEIYLETRFLDHRMSIFKLKLKGCPQMTDQFMLPPFKLGGAISPPLIMDANALLFSNLIGLKWQLFIIFFKNFTFGSVGSFMHGLSLAAPLLTAVASLVVEHPL